MLKHKLEHKKIVVLLWAGFYGGRVVWVVGECPFTPLDPPLLAVSASDAGSFVIYFYKYIYNYYSSL